MKVLKIVYKTKDNQLVRSIIFNASGLSLILGNVIDGRNLKESTNGVGKSILMKTIDYLFGANSDKDFSNKLSSYYFEGTVLIDNKEHIVTRYFEKNGIILFDGHPLSIEEYKQKINIERSEMRKLILLNTRGSISETPGIAYNANDLFSIFKLLNLDKLSGLIIDIKTKTTDLNNIKDAKKKLLDVMDISAKDIETRLAKNNEELNKTKDAENKLKEEIKTLAINNENDNIQKQFEIDNREIKKLRRENYLLDSEKSQLDLYLNSSTNFALTADEIKDIYDEAGIILQQNIAEQLKSVEVFYKKLIEDRAKQIWKRINVIQKTIAENNFKINQLNKSLCDKSAILSKNDAYQNAIILLSDIQNKLEDLNLESGRLEQYSKFQKRESEISKELSELYSLLNVEKEKCDKAVDKFKVFINETSKKLYDDDEAFFSIDFKQYKEKGLPCSLSIDFRKNQSGGIGLVKNILFDYLLFKTDLKNEILLHDSSCFADIDTRQISTLLEIGNEIAIEKEKQYIVALNEDSVHESAQNFILNKTILKLSENELLLGKKI